MLDYLSTQNALHTRLVDFNLQQYMFVLQVVLGERIEVAYANTFDTAEFKRNVPSENEEDYLMGVRNDAKNMFETQECKQLYEYLNQEYQSDIQEKSSTLKDFRFTGAEVQRLLNNLLRDRSQELSEASVRDIIALLKTMYDTGALDSGDSFQNHFITIPNKYNALCLNCSHEFYAVDGLSMKCPNCGAVYNWDEQQRRFIPEIPHL